jgi:hypothetical protein
MSRVFISYRRDDSAHVTGRIFDRLKNHFDKKVLFRDVDTIPYGRDFREVIQEAVEGCEILLAVIGPAWLDARNEKGERRLDKPSDFVRLEIEAAMKRGITVIPLLIAPARMPEEELLPESLRQLVYLNGPEVRRDPDFHSDMDRLIRVLTVKLGDGASGEERTPKTLSDELHGPLAGQQSPRQAQLDRERAERMSFWQRSGQPQQWAAKHLDGWTAAEWTALINELKASPFWPLKIDEVGAMLERMRDELRARRAFKAAARQRAEETPVRAKPAKPAQEPARRPCPRCACVGGLAVKKKREPISNEDRVKTKGNRNDSQEDTDLIIECQYCTYLILKRHLALPRLRFPVLSVSAGGTTFMVATAYDRFRKRTASTTAVIQPIWSSEKERFDMNAKLILQHRVRVGATVWDFAGTEPLLLHLKDNNPGGANTALVCLFDYPGEILEEVPATELMKSNAARMDGFILLLDPTQLYDDGDITLDDQLRMLEEFFDFARREREIPIGEVIPIPVAVCIPKFDLLPTRNPIGGPSIMFIRELLETMNPPPKQMTPEILWERSGLVEQMLPLIFPGVDIRSFMEGHFGKRVMFFPMSAVSLFEDELGETDLSKRTMDPFGVTEPIVWLLHMYGYQMF